jgi:hypothetical protein
MILMNSVLKIEICIFEEKSLHIIVSASIYMIFQFINEFLLHKVKMIRNY